jgi:hypothetical protein
MLCYYPSNRQTDSPQPQKSTLLSVLLAPLLASLVTSQDMCWNSGASPGDEFFIPLFDSIHLVAGFAYSSPSHLAGHELCVNRGLASSLHASKSSTVPGTDRYSARTFRIVLMEAAISKQHSEEEKERT